MSWFCRARIKPGPGDSGRSACQRASTRSEIAAPSSVGASSPAARRWACSTITAIDRTPAQRIVKCIASVSGGASTAAWKASSN